MSRTILVQIRDDVDREEYARLANPVWAVAAAWDEVESVHLDRDHGFCDQVYDKECCQEPTTWSGGRSKRTERKR